MMKIVAAVLAAATLGIAMSTAVEEPQVYESIVIQEKIVVKEVEVELENNLMVLVETTDRNELKILMADSEERMKHAESMITAALGCGYDQDHPIIALAEKEYEQANWCYLIYQERYKQASLEKQAEEYPAATEIWLYLKDMGFNDYVCAGIMGNLMTEVGGHTLDIQYWLRNKNYAGMCQWSLKYTRNVPEDLLGQCNLMTNTMEINFNNYGHNYKKNFNYEAFLNLTDEKEAALAFAMCYERCAPQHYDIRAVNATKAYNYFVN